MIIKVKAKAGATVANQPVFDGGGFAIKVIEQIAGPKRDWETLEDIVILQIDTDNKNGKITLHTVINEKNAPQLSDDIESNTATIAIKKYIELMKKYSINFPYSINVEVIKGLSIKGSGLGSSGASSAAAIRAFEKLLEEIDINFNPKQNEICTILKESDFLVPDNSIPSYIGGLVVIEEIDNHGLVIHKLPKNHKFGFFVLATPLDFGIKTSDARDALKGKKPPKNYNLIKEDMINQFHSGNTKNYSMLMEKAHEWFVNPRKKLYPYDGDVYEKIYNVAKEAGSLGVTISGAGPTILAVVEDENQARVVGDKIYNEFKKLGYESIVRLADINSQGAL